MVWRRNCLAFDPRGRAHVLPPNADISCWGCRHFQLLAPFTTRSGGRVSLRHDAWILVKEVVKLSDGISELNGPLRRLLVTSDWRNGVVPYWRSFSSSGWGRFGLWHDSWVIFKQSTTRKKEKSIRLHHTYLVTSDICLPVSAITTSRGWRSSGRGSQSSSTWGRWRRSVMMVTLSSGGRLNFRHDPRVVLK